MEQCEKLLRAGMSVARFNFSHGSHEYHQETLDNLREAMDNTQTMCAVMLDTKGPEIRTGFLEDGKPIQLVEGKEITITTDYTIKGNASMISMRHVSMTGCGVMWCVAISICQGMFMLDLKFSVLMGQLYWCVYSMDTWIRMPVCLCVFVHEWMCRR